MNFLQRVSAFLLFLLILGARAEACSFTPSFQADSIVCFDATVMYVAQKHSGNSYSWNVINGTILSGAKSDTLMVKWTGSGTGTVTLYESSGSCKDSLKKNVKIHPVKVYLTSTSYSLNGNASQSGKTVTLTTTSNSLVSAAWYPNSISLNNDFDFNFEVYLCGSADGAAFVIQNNGLKAISSTGGGDLGYYGSASKGIFNQSLAVELDIYNNGSYDSSNSHIAVVKNGSYQPLLKQYQVSSPSSLGGACIDRPFRVKWTANAKLLEVWYNGTKIYSYHVDLKNDIFKGSPNVYFGFTGATGGLNALQKFYYDSLIVYSKPQDVVPSIASPKTLCSGDSVTYTFSPANGFKNSDYGSRWHFSTISFNTPNGTAASNYKITYPSSSGNGKLVFKPSSSQQDSIYLLTIVTESDSTFPCDSSWGTYIAVATPPVAAFKLDSAKICQGGSPVITNKTTPDTSKPSGKLIKYKWYFGDGSTSNSYQPTHHYKDTGNFVISVVADNGSCRDSTAKMIKVFPNSAGTDFAKGSPFNGFFNNGTIYFPDHACTQDTLTYELKPPTYYTNSDYGTLWKVKSVKLSSYTLKTALSDTATFLPSSGSNYKVRVVTPAKYGDSLLRLSITVTSLQGGCDTSFERILKVSTPPVANFGFQEVCEGLQTTFYDSSDRMGSSFIGYNWDFGDGGTATQGYPVHTYSKSGTYNVTLRVTNDQGCYDIKIKKVKVYAHPQLKFVMSSSCVRDKIFFYDSSKTEGKIIKYYWQIGTYKSTLATPSYTFNTPGKYNVTMAVQVSTGCIDTLRQVIDIVSPPKASFTYTGNCVGEALNFNNTSTADSNATYSWDFGDATYSTDKNPTKIYYTGGDYKVTLTVNTPGGCSNSVTNTVRPYAIPVARMGFKAACAGTASSFYDSSDYNGTPATIMWYFGDGSTDTKGNPTHVYTQAGTYTVTMVIKNTNGCGDSIESSIVIKPVPTADYSATVVCEGKPTVFTNKSSGSGSGISYEWDFGDGSTHSTSVSPSHTYTKAGSYTVKLTVSESGCSAEKSSSVTVNPGPVPSWTFSHIGKKVTFKPNDTTFASYTWFFGDNSDSSTLKSPSHIYASTTEVYTVKLRVTDAQGCTGELSKNISLTGIQDPHENLWNVNIYPNPFTGKTNVSYSLEKRSIVRIAVTDMEGREVLLVKDNGNEDAGTHTATVDASSLPGGMYILKMIIGDQCYNTSIIQQK